MNPFTEARLASGLSQAELASLSNLTPLSILRHEQGLPSLPSGKLLLALNLPAEPTLTNYRNFQRNQRYLNGLDYPKFSALPPSVDSFSTYRIRILKLDSLVGFCVLFCVSQSSLLKYEQLAQRKMPRVLRTALDEASLLSYTAINELEKRQMELVDVREQRAKAS